MKADINPCPNWEPRCTNAAMEAFGPVDEERMLSTAKGIHKLVCPQCGFEKEPERKLEFCPKDGSAMRFKQVPPGGPKPEFRVGLRRMQKQLAPGAELPTIGERETFRVLRVTSTEVVIAPLSTAKERPISVDQILSVYRRWLDNERSYTASDYTNLTVNSVYILRLIREFWDTQAE